jgi:hypothetical protein
MAIDFGWDIGGVHLKAACLRSGGAGGPRLVFRQEPFEIWREPAGLAARLSALRRDVLVQAGAGAPGAASRHAVTMTAELSDVFPDRLTGVRAILSACTAAFGRESGAATPILVLGTEGELLPLAEAAEVPHRVAAANWAASSRLAARLALSRGGRALLIDVGSTTTDIIPLADGHARPQGRTDRERLISGELVYTGLLRTPPGALADRVPLGEGWCRVAPEAFTIMGDVYVLLGRIEARHYTVPTPDGRGRSRAECAARLARLICAEPAELGTAALLALAGFLEDRQIALVAEGIRQVAGRPPDAAPLAVLAGAGWFLGEAAARRAGLEAVQLSSLLPALGDGWDTVAPAASLAILLSEARGARGLLPPDAS